MQCLEGKDQVGAGRARGLECGLTERTRVTSERPFQDAGRRAERERAAVERERLLRLDGDDLVPEDLERSTERLGVRPAPSRADVQDSHASFPRVTRRTRRGAVILTNEGPGSRSGSRCRDRSAHEHVERLEDPGGESTRAEANALDGSELRTGHDPHYNGPTARPCARARLGERG